MYYYVGSPYTHIDEKVMEQRYRNTMAFTKELMLAGVHVFSPIVHCHEMAKRFDMPRDANFWYAYDEAMLLNPGCKGLIIDDQPGYENSAGLANEIYLTRVHNKELYLGMGDFIDHINRLHGLNLSKLNRSV